MSGIEYALRTRDRSAMGGMKSSPIPSTAHEPASPIFPVSTYGASTDPSGSASTISVAGLTRALAVDHAVEGIRVNAVCPGPIFTRFHERRATTAGKQFEEFKAEFGRNTMLKRPGTPREVAACILFLASDEASYVTGTCLFVDGGQTAM